MAVITVRDLGQVRIKGNVPTLEEKQKIISIIQNKQKQEAARTNLADPYPQIMDYGEVEEGNERTDAIEAYLKSPEFKRLALEIGFAVGGAFTGGTLAAARMVLKPAIQLLYRSVGSGIGQATGAGIASTTFDPKEELSKDVLRAFATGATFEAVGAAVPAMISKIKWRGIKTTKEADEAEKIIETQKTKLKDKPLDEVSKYDDELTDAISQGKITPGLTTENRAIDILENVAEKSLFGGGPILKARAGAITLANKFTDDFVESYGALNRQDYGRLINDAIINNRDAFRVTSNKLYGNLTKQAKGVKVNIKDVKKEARKLLKSAESTKDLTPGALKIPRNILRQNDEISFSDLNRIRSNFLSVTRGGSEDLIGGTAQRYAATLAKKLTEAVDDIAKTNLSPAARTAYNKAQKFYKKGASEFNDKLIKSLVNSDPEQVFKNVIKPERPAIIDRVYKVINRTKDKTVRDNLKNSLQGALLFDLKSESIKRFNKLNGDYMLRNLNKYGDSVLNKVFSPQGLKEVRSLFKALEVAQKKTVGEGVPGGIFIQLSQAGALFGLGAGVATGPAAALLFGPAIVAKLFTNTKVVNLLKQGFKLSPGKPGYYKWATRLMNTMVTEEIISEDEAGNFLEELESIK
jgi:hypothetical protein